MMGNIILHQKKVFYFFIKFIYPNMKSLLCFNQSYINPNNISGSLQFAFQNVAYIQFLSSINRVYRLPLVLKDAITCNNQKAGNLGKIRNKRLSHSITEIFLGGVSTHIHKWKNSY